MSEAGDVFPRAGEDAVTSPNDPQQIKCHSIKSSTTHRILKSDFTLQRGPKVKRLDRPRVCAFS